ncbi:MAG: T9SS type A sorting domain-containing protein [Paludibacter sp.]
MRKQLRFLRLSIALFAMCCTIAVHAAVIPYLPALQNLNGSTVDLSTFVHVEGDYTLEVQGSIGTEISVAGGAYTYTPTINGVVRFSQKAGKVYVYEGNVYKTTLTPTVTITYPTITDADAATNVNNLLQNASFETLGALVTGTAATTTARHAFGTPWVTNVTINGTTNTIRVGMSTVAVNGSYVCIWRGTANTNYFSQQVSATIKPNTSYKITVRQIAGGNAYAYFNTGLGSSVDGMEYGYKPLNLGNTKDGTWSTTLRTPASVTGATYFTFKNTATNIASSGTDPLTQMDYITLVEGTDVKGIVGVSSATFLAGTAYAPENVVIDYAAGDYYDVTFYIRNASFEDIQVDKQQTIPYWTKTGTANSEYCTRNDAGSAGFKNGNVYFQYWSNATPRPDFSISQIITGLPNGKYRVTAAAGGDAGTTGTYVYAQDVQTQVTSTGDFSAEAVVLDGSLTIGFKSVNRSVNWAFADNFRLYYLGASVDPVLTLSATSFYYDANNLTKIFNVSGANLTGDVTLTAPQGITLSKTTLTAAEAQAGVNITAQFTGSASIKGGTISVTTGSITKSISVTALYGDASCFTPLYNNRTNLVAEPFCNDRSKFGGWGNVGISELTKFCGERSLKVFGGSLDASVAGGTAIASNKTYRVRAKIFVPSAHTAKFGLFLIGNTADVDVYNSTTNDAWETADFTFKTATVGAGGVFFQRATGTDSVFIDNYEMYEVTEPTVRVKYVDAADVNTSIKADRVYTATWGTTLANYLTIGKTYSALTTDKDVVTNGGYNYDYDNTSVESVTVAEGENVIVLKFIKGLSTGNTNLSNSEVAVYPTMTDGNVNVSLSGKTGTIRVFDVAGRIVANKIASSTTEVVSLPSTGVFFVEVNSGNVTKTFKVIRMK